MDRVLIGVALLAGVAIVFLLLARGWRARRRSQAGIGEPASPPDDLGAPTFTEDLLYVASTRAEAPLDRITIAGLGFRARAVLSTAPAGLVLDLAGRGPVFIPRASILGVGRATWTIDRVVDADGLVFVRWLLGSTGIDSYLRSADPDRLVSALTDLTAPTPPYGAKEADA
ncbi:MAG TPA: hypothetical protein VL294_01990 [Pseudolysinimonas sp.]|nr:hypothetical protein [Pseudolysinimonas sp.]